MTPPPLLNGLYSLSFPYTGYFSKDRYPGVGVGGRPPPLLSGLHCNPLYWNTRIFLACIDNSLQLNPGGLHLSIRYFAVNYYIYKRENTNGLIVN